MIASAWLWLATAEAHVPVFVYVNPTDDWCSLFASSGAGNYVMLAPGDYYGPCDLVGKTPYQPAEYSTLTSQLSDDRARVHWDGAADYVFSLSGQQLQLSWIEFVDVPAGVDAVRIGAGDDLWVLDSTFPAVDGTGVRVVGPVTSGQITDSRFLGGAGTAIWADCATGGCAAVNLEVASNFVDGVAGGVVVSGVDGIVNDNVVSAANGLSVGGAPGVLFSVDANFVAGPLALTGPAVVTSNVLTGAFRPIGPGLRDVAVAGNTFWSADGATIPLDAFTGTGLSFRDNALSGPLDALDASVDAAGNVGCAPDAACWTDAPGLAFYPVEGSALIGAGVTDTALHADFCGRSRPAAVTAGALEWLGAGGYDAWTIAAKGDLDCAFSAAPVDTGAPTTPADTGDTGGAGEDTAPATGTPPAGDPGGCGCATGAPAPVAWGIALAAAAARRARKDLRRG